MDQNTRRHIIRTLKVAAAQILASVDAKAEFAKATKAMEAAITTFKAKPTDKAYLAAVDAMKDFRKWAFEAYYKDAPADQPAADIPKEKVPAGVPDRRKTPRPEVASASATDDFTRAYKVWTSTGNHKPLVAAVKASTAPLKASALTVEAKDPGMASTMKRKVSSADEAKELLIDAKRMGYTSFFVRDEGGKVVFIANMGPDDDWKVARDLL